MSGLLARALFAPLVAPSWVQPAPTLWELTIDPLPTWSDGRPLLAAHYAAALRDEAGAPIPGVTARAFGVAYGPNALRLRTTEPVADLPSRLAGSRFLPRPPASLDRDAELPLTCGAFRIASWRPDGVSLVRTDGTARHPLRIDVEVVSLDDEQVARRYDLLWSRRAGLDRAPGPPVFLQMRGEMRVARRVSEAIRTLWHDGAFQDRLTPPDDHRLICRRPLARRRAGLLRIRQAERLFSDRVAVAIAGALARLGLAEELPLPDRLSDADPGPWDGRLVVTDAQEPDLDGILIPVGRLVSLAAAGRLRPAPGAVDERGFLACPPFPLVGTARSAAGE